MSIALFDARTKACISATDQQACGENMKRIVQETSRSHLITGSPRFAYEQCIEPVIVLFGSDNTFNSRRDQAADTKVLQLDREVYFPRNGTMPATRSHKYHWPRTVEDFVSEQPTVHFDRVTTRTL